MVVVLFNLLGKSNKTKTTFMEKMILVTYVGIQNESTLKAKKLLASVASYIDSKTMLENVISLVLPNEMYRGIKVEILNPVTMTEQEYIDLKSQLVQMIPKRPRLLLIGHARHGKDTAAEYFRDNFGLIFKSSSIAAAELFIFDALREKYGYDTISDCFEDRVNHREEWARLVDGYNASDLTSLAKGILRFSDCYVGMRSSREIAACKAEHLFDLIIWVDASDRLPLEDESSISVRREDAHIIIDNNGTEEQFKAKLHSIGNIIFG